MAQHYSTKDFFRRAPNAMLEVFFVERGYFSDLNIAGMKETKIEALFDAWLELPHAERNSMEAELCEIHALSNEKGFLAIIDEAAWHLRPEPVLLNDFVEKLSSLPNHYHRAMTTFLGYREYWKGASRFFHADTLSYWRKRKHMGHNAAAVQEAECHSLAKAISTYFHLAEGRRSNCLVEVLRRGDLDYFFAYPEDHSQQSIEWVDGEFDNRPHNPAFEVVFVYSQSEGSLDLNYRGSRKAIEPLQSMFATVILKLEELPEDPKDERIYDLDQLGEKDFNFTYDPGSGIESVAIKKLQLTSRVRKGDRITLEANTNENPHGVHDLLDSIRKSVNLKLYNITLVELYALIVGEVDKPRKNVMFRITHPNSCSLKYDERDLKLRAMLEASGLEPKAAGHEGNAP